jgi:alcohol dehydrogenase class IV
MSPDVRMGPGVVRDLPEVLGPARRVLIAHGLRSYRAGAAAVAVDGLDAEVRCFAGVHPNPDVEQVREAVALAREYSPDAVLGIGGGSAMDVAKCVAVLAGCTGDPKAYLLEPGSLPDRRTTTLVQVPTISGSGSELTSFATVYIGRRKFSLDHPSALADHVLIDPDLAATVPVPTAPLSDSTYDGSSHTTRPRRTRTPATWTVLTRCGTLSATCSRSAWTVPAHRWRH